MTAATESHIKNRYDSKGPGRKQFCVQICYNILHGAPIPGVQSSPAIYDIVSNYITRTLLSQIVNFI